ncbi:MAG: phosphoribosylformylglycinamidine synthase subunit PurL [Nitrospirae bacterium]|nr:phosphoribosylformylglycinamidine synthase subunit PurL [Nitrospirota bacterium]
MLSKEVIERHGFTEEEYQRILKILGREPNMVELGIFSVMWSEHCSYKSSRIHLKKFPTTGKRVLQGPGENAGAIDIGNGLAAVFKMESHNHPSFIEPYQGAATGVGGILRDIFTMGARPVAVLNSLRFGDLKTPHNRHLFSGVVSGIAGYGNCIGIPTVGGEVYFDEIYNKNILVNVFALGIVRKDSIFKGVAKGVGNPVIYVGSKTGRDGIHGATMASDVFDETSEAKRPTVQVGDPFTEKLLLEACLEVMDQGLIVGIQDMGAAGLTSSSCEMAGRGGTGIDLHADRVPMREAGMTPYEVMLSESQERMLIVTERGREAEVIRIFDKWDLDAVVVGEVTDTHRMRVFDKGNRVADIPVTALTDEAPLYQRPALPPPYLDILHDLDIENIPVPADLNKVLLTLLSSPTIASKEWIYRQYDHMVRTDTIVLPGSDAAVIRVKGTDTAIAMSTDCNSRYCFADPRTGAAIAVAEAARNIVCAGGEPAALTDCLNFGNPERPEIMWQFQEAIEGISAVCRRFNIPVISGNVSLYNETNGISIYPTPIIGMAGIIEEASKRMTQYFKAEGDVILLIGENREEIGLSEYLKEIHYTVRGVPPQLDLELEKRVQDLCLSGIREGLIKSAHDTSEGGLAVALAECCMTPGEERSIIIGAEIGLRDEIRADALLFGETQSRIIITVRQEQVEKIKEMGRESGVPVSVIGRVGGDRLLIKQGSEIRINMSVKDIAEAWRNAIPRALED